MNKYKIYYYKERKGYILIDEFSVRTIYDPKKYLKSMPTLGERRCRKILRTISPDVMLDKAKVMIEDMQTGKTHEQYIYKANTIIDNLGTTEM
jgi:hypothetical protein